MNNNIVLETNKLPALVFAILKVTNSVINKSNVLINTVNFNLDEKTLNKTLSEKFNIKNVKKIANYNVFENLSHENILKYTKNGFYDIGLNVKLSKNKVNIVFFAGNGFYLSEQKLNELKYNIEQFYILDKKEIKKFLKSCKHKRSIIPSKIFVYWQYSINQYVWDTVSITMYLVENK